MDPISIVKEQERIANDIVHCYNSLSAAAQSNLNRTELKQTVSGLRASFHKLVEKFEGNDKELRPPSSTMERNPYFKTKFVDEVRETLKNFNSLYEKLKNKILEEERIANLSVPMGQEVSIDSIQRPFVALDRVEQTKHKECVTTKKEQPQGGVVRTL